MREPRNPFRLRVSEQIESDATFLRLFSPGVLDLLPPERLWDKVQVLRSAPGGGKTSLLRLFTPSVLQNLYAQRRQDECKELYQRVRSFGVLDDGGPTLLAVRLSCARNYPALADMEIDGGRKERFLFGLLNARIILAMLRGALALKKLEYPADLQHLRIAPPASGDVPPGLRLPCDGREIYEWAMQLEIKVCEAIDSLVPAQGDALHGHDTLMSLLLLSPESITVNDEPVAKHILCMLDDVHRLTTAQRELLLQTVVDLRSSVGVWIAERFEALSAGEMLSSGAKEGREYSEEILLENFWRDSQRKFESLVMNIADRRAQAASGVEISSFGASLQTSLDGQELQEKYERACSEVSDRVKALARGQTMFQEWVAAREKVEGSVREKTVAWRGLEVLIEREKRRAQKSLFNEALPVSALEAKDDSAVKAAAEMFLAQEYKLPYYFGPAVLAKLASSNIDQFLSLAGDEFEEISSAVLMKKAAELSPERQEAIFRKASQRMWDDIPRRVRRGREVKGFLEAIGTFSKWMSYQPTAPNDPGVNGIAISMEDRATLMDRGKLKGQPDLERLATIIASAIANNLLEPILDYRVKSGTWMVLNLNRLLCVRYNLPLNYGKFKEKRLSELCRWVEHGFKPPTKETTLI